MHSGQRSSDGYYALWYRIALLNLSLVAGIGLLLRYKILASIPWLNHKYFLHGHSHFAFAGWISLALMAFILEKSEHAGNGVPRSLGKGLLVAQLLSAYGMLFTFPFQGYAPASISFSTLSILVSYFFVIRIWRYTNMVIWGKAGSLAVRSSLVFLALSSLGAFWLAGLMASHSGSQPLYFSALYFFLHFQYNGWFFFGIVAIFISAFLDKDHGEHPLVVHGIRWLCMACIPAVLLSSLWMKVPGWVLFIAVISAIMQLVGVGYLTFPVRAAIRRTRSAFTHVEKWLLSLSLIALLLRVALQALSTIPALGKFAFAYRPVVIGYLHLILLGCISMFLIAFFFRRGILPHRGGLSRAALAFFIAGFLGTEGTLMVQGFGYIGWVFIPYTNEFLFASACLLFVGALLLFLSSILPANSDLPASG